MRFHQTGAPDVLATKYGSRIVFNVLFFVVLFGIGVLAMLAGVGAFGWETDAPPLLSILVGGALCAAGLGILTYRWGVVLDKRRGVLAKWRSVFGVRQVKTMAVGDVKRVLLRRECHDTSTSSGRSVRHVTYPVVIDGRADAFKFWNDGSYDDGIATAKHVAEALGVEVVDRSGETIHKTSWW